MNIINKIKKIISNIIFKRKVKTLVKKTNIKSKLDKSNWVVNTKDQKFKSLTYNKNVVEINSKNFKQFKPNAVTRNKLIENLSKKHV
jgi:hypothetical protein